MVKTNYLYQCYAFFFQLSNEIESELNDATVQIQKAIDNIRRPHTNPTDSYTEGQNAMSGE